MQAQPETAITIGNIPQHTVILSSPKRYTRPDWLNYFDPHLARRSTAAHIAKLSSTKNTPEKHTLTAYENGLDYFLTWAGDELPTEDLLAEFVAHLCTKPNHRTKQPGLKATTISSKYLAPVRIFLKALSGQHIETTMRNTHIVTNYREQIRASAQVKNPDVDEKSTQSALMRHGIRLKKSQVRKRLRAIDRTTLAGKRDYALLVTAFNTGLRLAELQRITLASISENENEDDEEITYIVKVRGKRNNYDPVAITDNSVEAINEYVAEYNSGLSSTDPRRITRTTPVWQSLTRSGNYLNINQKTGVNRRTKEETFYLPSRGLSQAGITGIIRRHAEIAPHDVRRTFAYLAFRAGMPIAAISRQMRHSSIEITQKYIGDLSDYKKSNLANYITLG